MARFQAWIRLPDAPDLWTAAAYADERYGRENVIEVVSTVEHQMLTDERNARARNLRLRMANNDAEDDGA